MIAVVDTGLAPLADLTQVLPGWDILGNDTNTDDDFGHGTWVSSVIGAAGDNGMGMAGYCWKCSIMPVRVAAGHAGPLLRQSPPASAGPSTTARGSSTSASRATASTPASSAPSSTPLTTECSSSAAAGNGGDTAPLYPGGYPGVLAVAGTDQNDDLYSWATRGSWVSFAAPGCGEVLDAAVRARRTRVAPRSRRPSSRASPGLLMSLDPSLTVNQITDALRATAHPVAGIAGGRVDAWAAAHYLGLAPANPPVFVPPPPPVPREVFVTTGVVRKSARIRLNLAGGPLELQLSGPAAINCSMSFRAAGSLYVDLPAERNVRSLAATLAAGSYPITVRCTTTNGKRTS